LPFAGLQAQLPWPNEGPHAIRSLNPEARPVHRKLGFLWVEFRLSSFERSGSLELFSQGEFEEGAELVGARRVPQLAQRFALDLADALAGEGEQLAHFFERVLAAVLQPEAPIYAEPQQ